MSRRVLQTAAKITATATAGYGIAFAIALQNEPFRVQFEKLPMTRGMLDFIEERNYQHRQRMTWEAKQAQEAYVSPYIRSQRPKTQDDDEVEKEATRKTDQHDPLSPEKFFDAHSGQVGGGKEYLPLLLLPDTRDPMVQKVADAMNDLISSVNSSAAHKTTIDHVAECLEDLSKHCGNDQYSRIFRDKANQFRNVAASDHKSLSMAILETENNLVVHCNSNACPNPATAPAPRAREVKKKTSMSFDSSRFETLVKLQISLSLLISALHNHFPVTTYVQEVKDTIASYPPSNKEQLLNDALKGITIPADINTNLQPILKDIINENRG